MCKFKTAKIRNIITSTKASQNSISVHHSLPYDICWSNTIYRHRNVIWLMCAVESAPLLLML